ncbi:collagenase 3-like [Homalodisca vitripennis]|uniref:collagenase 3-like n=1 Tax=Homalodisca vitripennis TaxID=197043 RepID=UPI001EEAF423|nr:collagenase 3-like [Homalodisca vitripennis]
MRLLVLVLVQLAAANKTLTYLEKYGYLNSNGTSLTNSVKDAVTRFQEVSGLQVTGYENEETLKLMDTSRCGNLDEGIASFSVNPLVKWNSTRITWNMIGSGIQYANIVERAFSLYTKHSALEFRRSYSNPTIMVVISSRKHVAYYLKSTCTYDFNGPGGVLSHAFPPRSWLNQSDIHLDFEEDWEFTMNIPAPEKTSFFVRRSACNSGFVRAAGPLLLYHLHIHNIIHNIIHYNIHYDDNIDYH